MAYSNHNHKNHYLVFGTGDFKVGSHLNGRAHPLSDDLEALLSPPKKFNGAIFSLELVPQNLNIGIVANADNLIVKAQTVIANYPDTVFATVSSPPTGAYYQFKSNHDGVVFYHHYTEGRYQDPKKIRSNTTQKLAHKDKIELRFGDYSIFLIYLVQEQKKGGGLSSLLKGLIGR